MRKMPKEDRLIPVGIGLEKWRLDRLKEEAGKRSLSEVIREYLDKAMNRVE